jgi:myo-inositol-1(or 4)-monophosphatase
MAAGVVVATEAGAAVTGLRGAPAGNAMTVAGSPELVAQLIEILEAADADGAGTPGIG